MVDDYWKHRYRGNTAILREKPIACHTSQDEYAGCFVYNLWFVEV